MAVCFHPQSCHCHPNIYFQLDLFCHLIGQKKNKLNTHAYLYLCVKGVYPVSMVVCLTIKSQAALTQSGELWKGGGHEITLAEPPLFSHAVPLSSLVIMAVLPHSCLFGAGPNRKRWECGEELARL